MLIVGLTGGFASGKTTVSTLFNQLGVPLIDADLIAHKLTTPDSPALNQISNHFGQLFIKPSGELDRKKLKIYIFEHAAEKKWLEDLLHPLIFFTIKQTIVDLKESFPYCLVIVPLLYESRARYQTILNRILVIETPIASQYSRASKRDNLPKNVIDQIITAQSTRAQRLSIADDMIENDGDISALTAQVEELHHHYLKLAQI